MHETSKAGQRRKLDPFFIDTVFRGIAIDIGAGPDVLNKNAEYPYLGAVIPFDKEHGDAEKLDEVYPPDSFDVVHASQCLEHMEDPMDALRRWIAACKRGGYLVISIPDFTLYEKRIYPSRFNPDHRAVFTITRDDSVYGDLQPYHANRYIVVEEMLGDLVAEGLIEIEHLALIDTNYNYSLPPSVDQTMQGAEAFIEFVLLKS